MEIKIIDTNVLLNRPLEETLNVMLNESGEDLQIVIPFVVLQELDNHKRGLDPTNVNARATIRFIGDLISKHPGQLTEGIPYKNAIIKIHLPEGFQIDNIKADNQIINAAQSYDDAVLVTEDVHERVLADLIGLKTQSASNTVTLKTLYTGIADLEIPKKHTNILDAGEELPTTNEYTDNQFIHMVDDEGTVSLGIYHKATSCIESISSEWVMNGIRVKKNKDGENIQEQSALIYLLLNPDIQIVTAIGPAGCGKTFLTLAAALEQTINDDVYNKIMVTRPLIAIGEDLGAFPGTKREKLDNWMGSMYDNLEVLLETMRFADYRRGDPQGMIEGMIREGRLEIESLATIRGRSLPKQFIIVDDAQNLTIKQALSILTRAGEDSKIVFLGDISESQIDSPKLNPLNNGLTYLVDRLKGIDPIVGHITMKETVRSRIAEIGVKISDG